MPNKRPIQSVSCLCGAEVRVDPVSQDRRVTCPACSSTFDFVVTMDQASRSPRLSLILPRSALKPEGESLALSPSAKEADAPPPPPPRAVTRVPKRATGKTIKAVLARCECGESFPVEDTGELTSVQSCPACSRAYHVVFKIESGSSMKSAIIVPTKPIVHRGEKLRTILSKPSKGATQAPPSKGESPDSNTTDFFGPGKKGRTRVTKVSRNTSVPSKPKAPPEIPAGAQAAPCSCGGTFVVRRRDVGQVLTCGDCGAKSRAVESRDPQTLAPVIRMKPV
ncbi:MAG TPA: hypothetical protein VKW04_21680 [Planctomycetota bacterium]|jgi:hypothetical protein|nr:hypothetical protein [Planctomycetota bacterium]